MKKLLLLCLLTAISNVYSWDITLDNKTPGKVSVIFQYSITEGVDNMKNFSEGRIISGNSPLTFTVPDKADVCGVLFTYPYDSAHPANKGGKVLAGRPGFRSNLTRNFIIKKDENGYNWDK